VTSPIWACKVCGQSHDDVPLSFAADSPDMYANMKEEERGSRAVIGSDQCIIDEKWFFVRGCLEIPIVDSDEVFLWGLWASVKQEVFDEISESWEEEDRESTRGPFKGRLANSLSVYPGSLNLKLRITLQPVGTRPLFVIEELEHPMASAQSSGLSRREARELAATLLHNLKG